MDQFYRLPLLRKRSHATELFPYSTKTWEAPRCQAKTYSTFFLHQRQTKGKVLLQKLNTGHASENNNNNHTVSSLAHYTIWIINLYFKSYSDFLFVLFGKLFARNTYYLKTLFYTSDTSRNISDKGMNLKSIFHWILRIHSVFDYPGSPTRYSSIDSFTNLNPLTNSLFNPCHLVSN